MISLFGSKKEQMGNKWEEIAVLMLQMIKSSTKMQRMSQMKSMGIIGEVFLTNSLKLTSKFKKTEFKYRKFIGLFALILLMSDSLIKFTKSIESRVV